MFIVTNKRFNPYSIRHSAITANSDYFPEYALKKMVKCSMNSKQGTRYTKKRMGDELNKILEHDSIISEKEIIRKSCIQSCPRCNIVNAFENKYCSKSLSQNSIEL
jgi:hypothetical protein